MFLKIKLLALPAHTFALSVDRNVDRYGVTFL